MKKTLKKHMKNIEMNGYTTNCRDETNIRNILDIDEDEINLDVDNSFYIIKIYNKKEEKQFEEVL